MPVFCKTLFFIQLMVKAPEQFGMRGRHIDLSMKFRYRLVSRNCELIHDAKFCRYTNYQQRILLEKLIFF